MTATENALVSGGTPATAPGAAVAALAALAGIDPALATVEVLASLEFGVVVVRPVALGDEPVHGLRFEWLNAAARRMRVRDEGFVLNEESLPGSGPVLAAARTAWLTGYASVVIDNDDHRAFPHLQSELFEIRFSRVGAALVAVLVDRANERIAHRRLGAVTELLDDGVALAAPIVDGTAIAAVDLLSVNAAHQAAWPGAIGGRRLHRSGNEALFAAAEQAWTGSETAAFAVDERVAGAARVLDVSVRRTGSTLVIVTHDRSEVTTLGSERDRAEDLLRSTLRQMPEQTAVCEPVFADGAMVDAVIVQNNGASERDGAGLGRRTSETFFDPAEFLAAARQTWATDEPVRYRFERTEGGDQRSLEACVTRCGAVILSTLIDRTLETRARQALDASTRRYRMTAEALPLGLILLACEHDPAEQEPTIVFANAALEALFGGDSVVGRRPTTLPLWGLGRELVLRAWRNPGAIERIEIDNLDQRLSADLPSCAIVLEARRFDDEVLVVGMDRTAQALTARRLAAANDRFVQVFDALDEALVVLDATGEVSFHNEAARRLGGFDRPMTSGDLARMEMYDVAGRRLSRAEMPLALVAATGEAVDEVVVQLHRPDTGHRVWARVSCRPLRQADGGRGALITCTDITDTLAVEERFRITIDALAESVVLYEPELDADGELVDARMLYMNPAGRALRSHELPVGFRVSERFFNADTALATMREVWRTGRVGRHSVDNSGPDRDTDLRASHLDDIVYRAHDLLIQVSVDHSQAVESARALASAEHRFAATIEALEEELAVFDPVLDADGRLVDLRIMYGNRTWHDQRERAVPAETHLLVSEYYVDAPQFVDAARRAWETRERVRYALTNPGRVAYPELRREHIEFNIVRIGDEVVSIGLDRSAEQATLRRFRDIAAHDHETGLLSQAGLAGRLTEMLEAGSTIGLVVIEIGQLEQVQRTYGLRATETVVREIAARLTGRLPGVPVARVGSSTFVAAFPGVRRTAEIVGAADDLVGLLQRPIDAAGLRLRLDASSGAVLSPLHGTDADTLVRRAKAAAWNALRSRLACCVWSPQLEQQAPAQEVALLSDIDRGLANGEFYLDYQPKLRLADHRLAGAEALVRWRHPERGIVPPAAFIPLIEDSTLARPFTERVIAMAVEAWRREPALAGLRVAVNLPALLINDPALIESVSDALVQAGVPATMLELEITERGLVGDDAVARANLNELRNLGVHLAIDDFGTGAASLSYLRWLPVESVKIDRTFVRDLENDPINRSVVEACVTVARALDLGVVAEGVETEVEARVAAELGCTYAQGYLYGRPGPLAAMLPLADRH